MPPAQHPIERLLRAVAGMDRPTIADRFRTFRGPFPVDFSPEFIAATDLDKLRHIYVALCIQAGRDADGDELAASGTTRAA